MRSSYLGCRWWVAAGEKSRYCRSRQYNSRWHTDPQLGAWCGHGGVWRNTEAPAPAVSCSPVTLALVLPSPALVTSSTAIYTMVTIFNSNYIFTTEATQILSDYWLCQQFASDECLYTYLNSNYIELNRELEEFVSFLNGNINNHNIFMIKSE